MTFDSALQRQILGQFVTGVTIVTTGGGDDLGGLTANAVASLSLDPPLVLVAVDRKAQSHGQIKTHGCFAMNILSAAQEDLSNRFATSGPKDFSDLSYKTGETGAPILDDTLGFVDCRVVDVLTGGDHDIFVGEVVAGELRSGQPLLYFAGKYRRLADA